jgi:GTP-binding protein
LRKYSDELAQRERWLILNKADLLPEDAMQARRTALVRELAWEGPVYTISAVTGTGVQDLIAALMRRLEAIWQEEDANTTTSQDTPWDPLQT